MGQRRPGGIHPPLWVARWYESGHEVKWLPLLTNSDSVKRVVVNSEAVPTFQSAQPVFEDGVKGLSICGGPYGNFDLVSAHVPTWQKLILVFVVLRLIVNMFMVRGARESKMEWAYALDLHLNGFFALFSWIYVLQLFLLPVITAQRWVSLWMGNTLYFIA